MKRSLWCVVAILSLGRFSFAQDNPNLEIGLKPYGSYQAGKIDVVNLDNGNVSLYQILRHVPQRGSKLDIDYLFRYNNKSYSVDSNCDPAAGCNPTWVLSNDLGSADSNAAGVEVTQNFVAARSGQAVLNGCDQASNTCWYDHINTLALVDGGSHSMGNLPHAGFDNAPAGFDVFNGARSLDGTGLYAASDQTVTLSNGVRLYTPYMTSLSGVYLEDPNGNRILWTMTPGTLVQTFTDTLGRTLPGLPTSLSDPYTTNYWGLPTTSDFSGCTGPRQIQSARVMNFPAYGGGSTPTVIKLCFVQIALQTNFGATLGAIEFSGTRWFLQSIVLPDLTAWTFEYDSRSPGDPSTVNYGDLTKVTLPTGGTISYSWQNWPPGPQAGYASVSRGVSTRTINANDGTGDHTWTYQFSGITPPSSTTTTVTEPIVAPASTGAKSIYTFAGGYETQSQEFDSSGNLLKTIQTQYSGLPNAVAGGSAVPVVVTTTLSNGQISEVDKSYLGVNSTGANSTFTYEYFGVNYTGSMASPTDEYIYDYGAGQHGPLLRHMHTDYEFQTNPNFLTLNLISSVHDQITYDGAGSQMAKTTYGYDESGLGSSGVSTQFNSSPINGTTRGNQTSVQRWLNTTNSSITSTATYFNTGTLQSLTDPLLHATTHSYGTFYAGAYPTMTCSPQTGGIAHCVTGTYDFSTGVLTSLTNENGTQQASGNSPGDAAHTSNFAYDSMLRITSATAPPDPANGGLQAQTSFTFSAPNVFPLSVQRTKSITASLTDSATSFFDGVGRADKTQHVLPNGTATVDTIFDSVGHPATVSNPYFSTSDPTYGITTNLYDALDRVYQITKQDGSITSITYDQAVPGVAGVCTVSTDEAGNQRRACSNALGRLTEVDEPGGPDPGLAATVSVTVSGAFNSTWVAAGTPHLAATGTALASVTMSDGSSHSFYFDTSQHLCQMSWVSGSGWSDQDLTSMTEAGLPSAGSSIAAVALGGVLHVFYQGANQHIYDMNWTGSIWQNLDMTASTGASPVSNTKMAIVDTGSSNTPMMFYEGTNQHLFCIYWNSTVLAWQNADLHSLSGATNLIAPNGSISAAMWGTTGNIHALFLDTNQNLNRIVWSGTAWITNNLTSITGAALAVPGSKLTTISAGTSIDLMTFYEGAGQHIYSIYWNGSAGTYQTLDFTVWSGATNIAAVLTSLANNRVGPHMFYFSSNQHLDDMLWNGSAWVNADLTSLANTTAVPASGSSLSSHGTAAGNTYHIFFEGGNQHIYHTFYSPSAPGWFNDDPLVTASNFIVDSGTVSLIIPNGTSNFTATVCYGVSTNPICAGKPANASSTDIANAMAAVLNGAGSPVNASASGATLSLTWRSAASVTATVAPMTSTSDNPTVFLHGSFSSTSGTFSGGISPSNQSIRNPFVTQYQYDALGNLLRVDQKGTAPSDSTQWRTRTFTYDSLSRLLTANNPESGMITYSYDADGNLLQKTSPAPNQTGTATQTVSFCYDALHRVTAKGYGAQNCPLATPVVTYAYDSGTNAIGKLTSLTDQAGTASYSYDILGRLATETRTLIGANNAAISKNLSYEYNLDGSLYKLHYPSGNVVAYAPGAAGLALSAIDSGSGINYVTGATYGPDSALTGFISGYSTSFAGITTAFSYNKRLQPLNMSANAPGQTVFSIGYDFHVGNGTSGADNGNVFGITNYKDSARNQTFTYDALNRLASARNAGTDCTATVVGGLKKFWGNNYTYDAWGNLIGKSLLQTPAPPACAGENLSLTADAHNWIHATGGADYQYDAAGNMMFNATPPAQTYIYDQENRLTGAAGYAYTYDGDGNRVVKSNGSTGTLYWYMTPGVVAESDLAGTLKSEYVFFDGERVARRDGATGTGGVFYYFSDYLKTASVITDSAGVIKAESDYYPWGGELQFVNNDSNDYKFTGKERDNESGLDNFGARMYGNALGRFITPDPLLNSGRPWDPQTWNRYAYAHNNPLTYVDPSGLYDWQANAGGSATDDELKKKSQDKDVSRKDRNAAKNALKFRDKFRAALATATAAAAGTGDQGALAAYGTEGDHNGVNVGTQLGSGAGTVLEKDDSISVNFGKDASGNNLAVTVAHEGQHVEDGQSWVSAGHPLGTMFDMNHYERETRAWGVSARIAQALGMSHFGPPGGGSEYYVWNSSWHNVDRVNTAIGNIVRDLYHQTPGDTDRYSKENPGHVPKYGPGCDCH